MVAPKFSIRVSKFCPSPSAAIICWPIAIMILPIEFSTAFSMADSIRCSKSLPSNSSLAKPSTPTDMPFSIDRLAITCSRISVNSLVKSAATLLPSPSRPLKARLIPSTAKSTPSMATLFTCGTSWRIFSSYFCNKAC